MSTDRHRLRVEFSTESTFRSEYLGNISNGGVFIATSEEIEVRAPVVVVLELSWCGEAVELEGEVVHRIGEEMAETGAIPGVAIQFDLPAKELRQRFEPVVGELGGNERVTRTGRRAAPRSPARITVRLQLPDGSEVAYRTRDVSTTGVLLSLQGEATRPIGEEVGVVVEHPTRDEEMAVNGAVVRHLVTEDGAPTAMGIEFRTTAARRTEVTTFMNDIRAAEHRRRMTDITGPVADLGIENLLQMFGASSPRGTLTVTRGAEEGIVLFDGGRLHTARLGHETGTAALRELLTWRDGQFEYRARIDEADLEGEGEGISLEAAILDALCAIDERSRGGTAAPANGRAGADGAADDRADDLRADREADPDEGSDLDQAMRTAGRRAGAGDPASGSGADAGAAVAGRRGPAAKLDPALLPPRKRAASRPGAKARPGRAGGKGAARPAKSTGRKEAAAPARPKAVRVGQQTRFVVDSDSADAMRSELGKIEQAVLDLALVGMPVGRMVDVIPEPELEVYRALDALIERGILATAGIARRR